MDRQQRPASVHCTVTSNHVPVIEAYVHDLREAVAEVKANPQMAGSGNAAMYGMMAKVPFRGMIDKSIRKVMKGLYGPGALAPDPAELAAQDDGLVSKILERHGPALDALLDRIEGVRERLAKRRR